MPKVNRNAPKRSTASESRYSLMEFDRDFPDDAACLDYLVRELYPNGIYCPTCQRVTKHHRDKSRPSYACQFCGRHEHPMVGTIFENSATSLRLWFYAMYLMASTRCGISAKQLERELGVTYKTAWRMFKKIRSLMADDPGKMGGTVEVDETYIGGKRRYGDRRTATRSWSQHKQVVAGHAQRGGKVRAVHLKDGVAGSLVPLVREYILPASNVYTDELPAYTPLAKAGYRHKRVHHAAKVYVDGDVHTNTIDGFWALVKNGISGIYRGVSSRHLQSYLDEYTFRYNNRENPQGVFNAMTSRIQKTS
ncbi:MAG: IS1595 family transposase [Armatimonadota bacterium]|nr:IS1595 family transposase [Armatimonadota bacterium]